MEVQAMMTFRSGRCIVNDSAFRRAWVLAAGYPPLYMSRSWSPGLGPDRPEREVETQELLELIDWAQEAGVEPLIVNGNDATHAPRFRMLMTGFCLEPSTLGGNNWLPTKRRILAASSRPRHGRS